ncbi:MAG TPA: mercury(II) reductase [Ktedonobacterales bacterium]|nr:mercury(II) reductase [Ktedonobacterales bacterium]
MSAADVKIRGDDHCDLLILGSGSSAFAAATRASELGKTAIMAEERTLGGTCVNRGCLPSKHLIEAARLVYDAAHPRYPGLVPARVAVDFGALIAEKDRLIAGYREQHYVSLLNRASAGRARVVHGRARLVDAHTAEVSAPDGGVRRLTGEHVLIATGAVPAIPEIEGLDATPYLTSDLLASDTSELTALPASLVILGGGAVALELGQLFARLGSAVTILERAARLLPGHEPEISRSLTVALRAEGIQVVTRVEAQQVTRDGDGVRVAVLVGGQPRAFAAERLLVAAGRRPNTADLGLERAGVRLDVRGAVVVDAALRTSVPHIWAAGDVIGDLTGSQMATPVGARDGGIAASNALTGAARPADHTVIPRAIFTDPPLATVGLTDRAANAQGHDCVCNAIPLSVVPRAGATLDARGVVKLVLERATRRVLGVSMVGAGAAEVIHEAAMAMRFGATADDFIEMIHVYPTMAEALKLAAIAFTRDVSTLSCCAS